MTRSAAGSAAEAAVAEWQRHLGPRRFVASAAFRRWLAGGTITALAARTLGRDPSRRVLEIDGREAAAGDLLRWSADTARELLDRGVRAGGRVLIALPSSLELVASYLGVLEAGCAALIANPALTRPELAGLVADAEASYGLVTPPIHELLGRDTARGAVTVALAGAPGPATSVVGVSLATAGRHAAPVGAPTPGRSQPGDVAVLAYTSGSTGEPKGVPLTHANLLSNARAVMAAWRWSGADVVAHGLPLFHQHGLSSIHALVLGGGRTVIRGRFDPEELAAVVDAEHATIVLAVPAMLGRIVEAAPRREHFASLRLLVSGSAPLPPVVAAGVEELTGQVPLERYGTTESGLNLSNPYVGRRRAGSVGYPLPGVEVRIVEQAESSAAGTRADGPVAGHLPGAGPGANEVVPLLDRASPGPEGEILVRGPQVFAGYWHRSTDDPSTFAPGAWFRTGDVGRVDPEDGSYSITGRLKELIITGGMNVYPRDVELVLERHPDVLEVAVAGIPSDRWGEAVCAFIVRRASRLADPSELESLCRSELAPYKNPKQFVFVESLPKNAMGKIQRKALPDLLDQGRAR